MNLRKVQKFTRKRKKIHNNSYSFAFAFDIKRLAYRIIDSLSLKVKKSQIFFIRSRGSKSKAYARIWGLNRVWQTVLKQKPSYVIEVISEKFDKLPPGEKEKVLIHELCHIPSTFSGSLLPHRKRGRLSFSKKVDYLFTAIKSNKIKF